MCIVGLEADPISHEANKHFYINPRYRQVSMLKSETLRRRNLILIKIPRPEKNIVIRMFQNTLLNIVSTIRVPATAEMWYIPNIPNKTTFCNKTV